MQNKIEITASFEDRLHQLTEFNQALVYGFEPEAISAVSDSITWEATLFPSTGQFEDMLSAYLHAQDVLLPKFVSFTEGKTKLSEKDFLNSICELHGFIGKTILNVQGEKSGRFIQQQVLRWNPNMHTDALIFLILNNNSHHPYLKGQDPMELLCNLLKEELNISKKETLQFIELLKRLKDDPTIKARESQKPYIKNDPAMNAKEKFVVAYHTNKLTEDERALS